MQVNWQFNANQYEPNQGMGIHPPAQKIPFQIVGTEIKDTKDKTGSMLVIEFSSPLGTLIHRYNIRNNSPKATEIAYGQLSALCRAVNIYNIDGNNECAALRGGRGLMDVGYQAGEAPDSGNPDAKGYTELKKVYDLAGNEPGKAAQNQQPAQQAQPQPAQNGATPMTQQPGGGWGQPQQGQQPQQQQPAQQQPQGQPQGFQQPQQSQPQGQAWQPGGGAQQTAPPWGNR